MSIFVRTAPVAPPNPISKSASHIGQTIGQGVSKYKTLYNKRPAASLTNSHIQIDFHPDDHYDPN